HFVETNSFQQEIERQANQVAPHSPNSAEQASQAIRTLFEQGAMPDEITQAVTTAYQQLVTVAVGAVAVRSSATAEDLPGTSFAGQYDTSLNIQTTDDLMQAIRRCWSSLWSPRALHYRASHASSSHTASLAVVVQQMVQASAAGVLFTVNPVTGARDELVINATWGLGESLVSGNVTPDTIIAEKARGHIKQVEIGDKAVMTISTGNRTGEVSVEPLLRQKAVLSPEQVAYLTQLGCQVESHFGSPQDIEWAIDAEQIYLLQARPITTLKATTPATTTGEPIPPGDDSWDRDKDLPPQPFDLWTRVNVGENLPFPVTPLTETNFGALFNLDKDAPQQDRPPFQATRRLYGRLYFNQGAIVHAVTEEYGLPASFMNRMWGSRRSSQDQAGGKFRPLRLLRKLPSVLSSGFTAMKSSGPRHTPEQFFAQVDQWVTTFMQQDLRLLDDRALWAAGLPTWRERGAYAFATNVRISAPSGLIYALLGRIVKWWTGKEALAQDLITSPSGVYSAEVGPAIWQMAQAIQNAGLKQVILANNPASALMLLRNTPQGQPFIEQLTHFLERHGHRCPNELELLNPRWSEQPAQVVELVQMYLLAHESINPIATETRQRQRSTETTAIIEAKLDPWRRAIFRAVLKRAQHAVTVRDNSRYYMTKFIFPMRKLYAELGQRWAERGWLKQADDIFFLTASDIQTCIEGAATSVSPQELQSKVANRQLAYQYWFTIVPPDAIGPAGMPIIDEVDAPHILQGTAASSGSIRGRARIVQTVHEAMRLTSGDILVTQATDPGWTPVFPLVSGIVLEIGGQLSHGAIIAREYAIPAVVNVQGAMRLIQDGQEITVDGTHGRIYLHDISFPVESQGQQLHTTM
ncbi:MAG TPA: PEP/pyruvate-binding domain-containing protein, partial [Ktedonobacteraceae bacterium]